MYRLHADDFFTDPRLPLAIAPRNPQLRFPLHSHDFSELVLVLSGRGIHFTEDEEYRVSCGDVYLVTGPQAHGYRELEDLVLINILFLPEPLGIPGQDLSLVPGFHTLFTIEPTYRSRDRFESRLRLDGRDLAKAASLVEEMETELSGRTPGYRFAAVNRFHELILFLSRSFDRAHPHLADDTAAVRRFRLGKVISFMESKTHRPVTIEELTTIAGSSESTLLRDFKLLTGRSPTGWHLRLRLDLACRLLRSTRLPVTHIALDTGFSDSNYFARQFRKTMGMSPREYRQGE